MFATIQWYDHVTGTSDDLAHAGRQLASRLSQEPGFISYVVLLARDGVLAAIGLFEDAASAEEASRLACRWIAENLGGGTTDLSHRTTGEVIAQLGL
jgi:hypothetical protein